MPLVSGRVSPCSTWSGITSTTRSPTSGCCQDGCGGGPAGVGETGGGCCCVENAAKGRCVNDPSGCDGCGWLIRQLLDLDLEPTVERPVVTEPDVGPGSLCDLADLLEIQHSLVVGR